jgi:hypothetical protein
MTSSSPKSPLTPHVRVPQRAMRDRRLQVRDHCVLEAVCVAVDNSTATALIGQKRIADLTKYHRNTVWLAIEHLVKCGYLVKIGRGRRGKGFGKGRFRTNLYLIVYDPDFDLEQTKPSVDHAHSG